MAITQEELNDLFVLMDHDMAAYRNSALEHIYDLAEFRQLSIEQALILTEKLIQGILYEPELSIFPYYFRTLERIFGTWNGISPNLEPLIVHFSAEHEHLIVNTLQLFRFTANRKLIPVALRYQDHPNAVIRKHAAEAIIALGGADDESFDPMCS